jgi:hypothetical protein
VNDLEEEEEDPKQGQVQELKKKNYLKQEVLADGATQTAASFLPCSPSLCRSFSLIFLCSDATPF